VRLAVNNKFPIKGFSEPLSLKYEMDNKGTILFEDGVTYLKSEWLRIPKDDSGIKAIHNVKSVFKKSKVVRTLPEGFEKYREKDGGR